MNKRNNKTSFTLGPETYHFWISLKNQVAEKEHVLRWMFQVPMIYNYQGIIGCTDVPLPTVPLWENFPPKSQKYSGYFWVKKILQNPIREHNNTVDGWWKKSCTTWDGYNPINNGMIIILGGAGFLPSTVSPLIPHVKRGSTPNRFRRRPTPNESTLTFAV